MTWALKRGAVSVRPTKHGDVTAIQDRLRKSDVDEIWNATHMTPREALEYSVEGSPICQTLLSRYLPVGIFGFSPIQKDVGGVWFVATDDLTEIRSSFLRISRECVSRMLSDCPLLVNWVDQRNMESIAWLKWLGAEMDEAKPFGPDGKPFHYFQIRKVN